MMVKFAQTCDFVVESGIGTPRICSKRSEEYSSWPSCRECSRDICPEHTAPGSLEESHRDRDGEAIMTESVICLECAAEIAAEDKA